MRLGASNAHGPLPRSFDGAWCAAEGDEVTFEAIAQNPTACRLSGARLQPLDVARRGSEIVTTWRTPIHTWAGRAEVEVSDGTTQLAGVLDIAPHPGKLGIDAFREMLDEISAVSRDLPWGLSPGTLAAARTSGSPAVVHPAVLEHELPVLLAALAQLCRDPLLGTLRSREVKSIRHARQMDSQSLRWLCAHPRALLAIGAATRSSADDGLPWVEQRRTRPSLDHPATAQLRFLLERLVVVLRRNAKQLDARAGQSAPEDRAHAAWLAAKVIRAAEEVTGALGESPLVHVVARPATEGAAQAVTDHPVYSRVQRTARRLLDPGAAISEQAVLRASARRTHELYELLVLYRLLRMMADALGSSWTWSKSEVVRMGPFEAPPLDSVFVARGPDAQRVEIRYQSTFGAYRHERGRGAKVSISGERRPDLIIGLFEGNELLRWLIVDAKYSASRASIHLSLADVHVYRDALRWYEKAADGTFIAVPGCAEDAAIYTTRAYHGEHRFGAIVTASQENWSVPLALLLNRSADGIKI